MTTVLGVPELLLRFAKAIGVGELAAEAGVDGLGEEVATSAQARAPVDTGTLRNSITYDGDGRVYTDVDYAPFVEYGTSNTPAQPFMRPAADEADSSHALELAAAILRAV